MQANHGVLIIFIKNLEKGKVKTRLAATVGEDKALAIYKSLLEHTRNLATAVSANRLLFYSERIAQQDSWSNTAFDKHLQYPGNLGERMEAAFEKGFEDGSPVMIIGSDCPKLTTAHVNDAFEALQNHDFVLGPALDGGYYLLGMKNYTPEVFRGITWSTDQVAQQTRTKINALGGSLYELPALSDIDYEEDWEKHGWALS